ncbi:cation:proton antiporter [Roseivivax isoporae]|uniref:Cation:proton antiporter n=1 Tax=Roseivivax isoporae LMG 25204 TaxID=1449351 RepID=X7F751_9RHOB|nr:monovalent cation/H(+) antiporter subunit G [Roseivivax isoporae]ETX28620.1 hypothetical protein RISW2_05870 [Roseivivax isoporae LMG 25204]
MATALATLGTLLATLGVAFLLVAAIGVWRLPDTLSRLHALTKADTAGTALVALGALCLSGSLSAALPLVLCVTLVGISGATLGHLIARAHLGRETR